MLLLAITLSTLSSRSNASAYIAQTSLSHQNAHTYCQQRCLSGLLSVHSDMQMSSIQTYLSRNPAAEGIWIGLEATHADDYHWLDGTPFDFGGNVSDASSDPWAEGEPQSTGRRCVMINSELRWVSTDCATQRPSLC